VWEDKKENVLLLLREEVDMVWYSLKKTLVATASVRNQWPHSTVNWGVNVILLLAACTTLVTRGGVF
jgi:hypothetical protein